MEERVGGEEEGGWGAGREGEWGGKGGRDGCDGKGGGGRVGGTVVMGGVGGAAS